MFKFGSVLLSAGLAGCGGGGGGGGDAPSSAISYMTSVGLSWSAASAEQLEEGPARSYCTQRTCNADGTNCRMTNFNGQEGWRLPNSVELQALYAANRSPAGWVLGPTWSNSGLQVNFATGQLIGGGAGSKAHVTCVKPV